MELDAKLDLRKIETAVNVEPLLSEDDSKKIGLHVTQTFEDDKSSRRKWDEKMEDATELALQITKDKTYPWTNASNVKFPLLTIASLQFASRAYPALVKAPDLVKYRVQGEDPEGGKAARALRISSHMSYQLLDQDESWEEDQDRAFIALPILGCIFKKSYYDPTLGHNCSKLVLPQDLYVHYYARSIEECERKTELFSFSDREIRERVLSKIYSDKDLSSTPISDKTQADSRQGITPPANDTDRARVLLEQHCYLDLDGDGYKEPYVVTVDQSTSKVLRIVSRFKEVISEQSLRVAEIDKEIRSMVESLPKEGGSTERAIRAEQRILSLKGQQEMLLSQKPKVLRIEAVEYYTKYPFIPSPDGGFYDLGFGALLSPLNSSVNTLINQLIDSGSLQNGSVGFIGKGARIKGGRVRFEPNEWKRVDVSGPNLRDSLVPLPVNQPSAVLFNLLSLLISYTERVASVTDANTGQDVGQNTPAYNMSAMLEQGLQVFNGIFKRVYRSFRSELRKLYALNGLYLDETEYFEYHDSNMEVVRGDYAADSKDLIPAADPNAFSDREKQQKAMIIAERAQMAPGYDGIKVEQRFLEAMDIPDANEIFPLVQGENGEARLKYPPQPDPEFEIKRMEEERRTLEAQDRAEVSRVEAAARMMVAEATVMEKMANIEHGPALQMLEMQLKDMIDQRKTLVKVAEIEAQKEADERNAQADSGVG